MADQQNETPAPNQAPIGIVTPQGEIAPPAKAEFVDEGPIAGEPATDRKIVLESGLGLRERIIRIAASGDNASNPAVTPAPSTFSFAISNALLDEDDGVQTDAAGRPMISTRHEFSVTSEALGRLGTPEAVAAELDEARKVAAARAENEFRGARLMDEVLSGRSPPLPTLPTQF